MIYHYHFQCLLTCEIISYFPNLNYFHNLNHSMPAMNVLSETAGVPII